MAAKKIDSVAAEALERPVSKSLQRGEDSQFDQVVSLCVCTGYFGCYKNRTLKL
jgi:hypothetical protein